MALDMGPNPAWKWIWVNEMAGVGRTGEGGGLKRVWMEYTLATREAQGRE